MRHDYPQVGTPVWIDLDNPTPEEIEAVSAACGLRIPSRQSLDEIESSSRIQAEGDTLTLSLPVTPYQPGSEPQSAPIGFVVTPNLLISVRFDELFAFRKVREQIQQDSDQRSAARIFTLIIEAIIDFGADKLEQIKADARALSTGIFHRGSRTRRNVARKNRELRETLVKLGDMGERLSEIRETLLALQRAIPFVVERGGPWIGNDVASRLKTASADILSLNDFETHLTDKVQFLLDATLGFINNEQNDIFKVLTIASIVGIPPTFVVGFYGMNFHNMSEYNWAYGYQWGMVLIVLSIIIPVAWFKWRGWW